MPPFDPVETARAARRGLDFPQAERILNDALGLTSEPTLREELLRELFYLYFAPVYENLPRAQWCLEQMESINPSAHNGMEWALFMLNCRQNTFEARRWAEITSQRAESERSMEILYSATALAGYLAAKEADLPKVHDALRRLNSIIDEGQWLPWGDEVGFLEASIELTDDIQKDAAELAKRIAPRIQDPEYKARAQKVGRVADPLT
jgi:hypothetical protein